MMEQRNLILAVVLSIGILLGYQLFFEGPRIEKQQRQAEIAAEMAREQQNEATPPTGAIGEGSPVKALPQGEVPRLGAVPPGVAASGASRTEALKAAPRIRIDSPRLRGSISLRGARIDDLILKDYRVSLDKSSDNIELLQPTGSPNPYYAEFGWIDRGDAGLPTPTGETLWSANGDVLTVDRPVTLTWDNGQGLIFERVLALDQNYLFTVTQRVRNTTGSAVTLAPYGLLSRTGTPPTQDFYLLHEGLLGVFDGTLKEVDYDDIRDEGTIRQQSTGGWIGITDKYWLVALIPDQQRAVATSFSAGLRGLDPKYQTDYLVDSFTVPAGGNVEETSHLFAGAKEVELLDAYAEELPVNNFDLAVDFGWFYWLTKPIFYALLFFHKALGNFGLAILALTVCIKLIFFPLANKSYESMSKMKKLQPKLVELRERMGEDRQRLNQEMMALYKKEKVNPAAGCLPILVQIPVFFALYKVLFVTIEMRQAPFYGWIQDLSQPDPLGLLTLFGAIPWDVPAALSIMNIGIWPILMGLTMYVQQRLNPAPTDPIQAKVFLFMPLIFTFLLGNFPAGLVIYWAWNNALSILQQYVIMRRMGVPVGNASAGKGGKS